MKQALTHQKNVMGGKKCESTRKATVVMTIGNGK